jgi:tetratricopeptide (TPR) repeat protein
LIYSVIRVIRSKWVLMVIAFLVAACTPLIAQDTGESLLRRGITRFGEAGYDESIRLFRDIILDSNLSGYHDEAYFWIAKSYIALGHFDDAEKNLDFFIAEFPDSPFYDESLYQRGRLMLLQGEYESSILALAEHIDRFPDSDFVANSYFWIGEALYTLGRFDEARDTFSVVIETYPASFKVEAARYRISLIDLKEREEELLRLIKWSHEEYLAALEEFQRRERSYEQAIAAYRRRIAELAANTREQEIASLRETVDRLENEAADYRRQVEKLSVQLDRLLGSPLATSVSSAREELLDLKTELLDLKSTYLDELYRHE